MQPICAIISGGPCCPLTDIALAACVIACDKGYEYAQAAHVRPHLVVGDFDSYTGPLPAEQACHTLPTHKDDTDTRHAMQYALQQGYRTIWLYCALGGRADHTMANLQCAAQAALQGAQVVLRQGDTTAYLLHNASLTLTLSPDQALSLLALSDTCHDVNVCGAEYSLDHATLTNTYPLGVSNAANGTVRIQAGEGVLCVWVCPLR